MRRYILCVTLLFAAVGCSSTKSSQEDTGEDQAAEKQASESSGETDRPAEATMNKEPVDPDVGEGLEAATFAGGCFWCMEPPFEDLEGVKSVVSGFSGGEKEDPAYREVATGMTDHTETVRITYDPEVVGYEKLLEIYWRSMDPTDDGGQFADRGSQYRPVIFYHDQEQKKLAEESRRELEENGPFDEPIVVPIEPAGKFWKAKEYHQNYYKKKPEEYKEYYRGSGRAGFLKRTWGKEAK